MRPSLRLLAIVKPGRYLEAGNPTGLTGLLNHPTPRSTLLYLYGSTLDKLKGFPDHSVYKQSTEALTRHRMKIIESIKPEGFEQWQQRASELVEKNLDAFKPGSKYKKLESDGGTYMSIQDEETERQLSTVEWEPEPALEASQISEAETQIGAGLIEEVIQVAEGELKVVDLMLDAKVWDELDEKPIPGQWDYFSRDQHTPGTQEPPNK